MSSLSGRSLPSVSPSGGGGGGGGGGTATHRLH